MAQHPYFYNLNDEDKLPSNEVYNLKQDHKGLLWIGCDAGLYRYDGFGYRKFSYSNQHTTSVSNLLIAKNNTLWCQDFSGLIFFKKESDNNLNLAFDVSHLVSNFSEFTLDNKGRAWILTDHKLFVVDENKHVIQKELTKYSTVKWSSITTFDEDHIAAIDYSGQILIFNIHDFSVRELKLSNKSGGKLKLYSISNRVIIQLNEVHEGRLSFSFFDLKMDRIRFLSTYNPQKPSESILTLNQIGNQLMLGTSYGAFLVNKNIEPIHSTTYFENQKISCILRDKEHNLWFSSLQDGLFVIPNLDVNIFNSTNSNLFDSNLSFVTKRNQNELIIGAYNGQIYSLDEVNWKTNKIGEYGQTHYRAVRKIQEANHNLYVAHGPFSIIDEFGKITEIPDLPNVRDFDLHGDTILYIGSDEAGLYLQKSKKEIIIRKKGGKKVLLDEKTGFIYFLFTDGTYVLKNEKLEELKFEGKSVVGQSLIKVNGEIWFGSLDQGLFRINKNGHLTKLTQLNQLLLDLEIRQIFHMNNSLVVASRKGVSIIDVKRLTCRKLTEFDGLAYKEVNSIYVSKNIVYLATIKGLVTFPISIRASNEVAPIISIENIRVNNKSIAYNNGIALNYNDLNLEFIVSSSALRSRGNYWYKYRMRGLDNSWKRISARQNTVNFSTLPSGTYVFEMVAMNEDGVESKPYEIAIVVRSPIYQKWWFYLLVSLSVLIVALVVFRFRLIAVRRKAELHNRIIQSQMTALKAQMNPHFMYNALNSIQSLILEQNIKGSSMYLSKFSQLMRKILELSGKETIRIQEEVEVLELYLMLEKLRFGDEFTYEIEISPKHLSESYMIPPMLLQPFVENSLKHGLLHKMGDKHLKISFIEAEDDIVCQISDNGIGRKHAEEIKQRRKGQYSSFASDATSKRIDLLKEYFGDSYAVTISDLFPEKRDSGTQVIIHFPKVERYS